MSDKEDSKPTNKSNPPVDKPKPHLRKPVIVFYKNNAKSGWQMYPQVCFNEKIAKEKIHVMTGADIVKCIDVPESVQNG